MLNLYFCRCAPMCAVQASGDFSGIQSTVADCVTWFNTCVLGPELFGALMSSQTSMVSAAPDTSSAQAFSQKYKLEKIKISLILKKRAIFFPYRIFSQYSDIIIFLIQQSECTTLQ